MSLRTLRATSLAAFALLGPARALLGAEAREATPFGWLADLAGACWVGSDAEGQTTDRQCYALQFGRFLRGTIAIESGSATGKRALDGDSVFAWDAARQRIVYTYWASTGHHGRSEAHFDGERLVFPPADEGEPGRPRFRSIWTRTGEATFEVVREREVDGAWQEAMRVVYRREALPTPEARPPERVDGSPERR